MSTENVSDVNETDKTVASGENDKVAYETYKKVLKQYKQTKAQLEEYSSQVSELKARQESEEVERLEKQKEFQKLYEAEKSRAEKLAAEKQALESSVTLDKKRAALKAELGGVKKEDYLSLASIDAIKVGPDGSIDSESLKEVANTFREQYPDVLVGSNSLLPNKAAGSAPAKLTHDQWVKLPLHEKKARYHEVFTKE